MDVSEITSIGSLIIALGSLTFTIISSKKTRKISEEANSHAKKTGIADLHAAWAGIRNIDVQEPATPQVDAAVRALHLTSEYWLHEIVDRDLIHEYAWTNFQQLYEDLEQCDVELPGTKIKGCNTLNESISRTYGEMKYYKRVKP